MKLSEIQGERALDVLADIIDPVSEIVNDDNVVKLINNGQKLKAVKALLKEHKRSVITIMALLNGHDPETYEPKLLQLPIMVLEILNDPDLADLFTSGDGVTPSGSPMESTEVVES